MARQECIKITCDRCKREELRPLPKDGVSKKMPDFEARHGQKEMIFEDLCKRCAGTIENLWGRMREWERDVGPEFEVVNPEQAAPLAVPPSYSPPQPHSKEASKR